MNFEKNQINTTINKEIDRVIEIIKDDAKPFFAITRNVLGASMPFTITDKELKQKILDPGINENTRIEALMQIVKAIPKGERMKLIETLIDTVEDKEFTSFQKSRLLKMSKN